MTSNPHQICDDGNLEGVRVNDTESSFHDVVPMPAIMIAQMECIMYTRFLHPLSEMIMIKLRYLLRQNRERYWLTIYLTSFILLHSGSMITRRNWETARQYGLEVSPHSTSLLP